MNPNIPHWDMRSYPHVNPASFHWNHNFPWNLPKPTEALPIPGPSAIRGNFVHVNPAFFPSSLPPSNELPNPKRIIVNPKFFPHVQNELTTPGVSTTHILNGEGITLGPNVKVSSLSSDKLTKQQQIKSTTQLNSSHNIKKSQPSGQVPHLKPSPIRHFSDRNKLNKLNLINTPGRSKYKWRKMESPLKATTIRHAYKLVRKTSVPKSPKMGSMGTLRTQYNFKILSPPKLTSTPIEIHPSNSRFKLDNRVRNKKKSVKSTSTRASLPKILHNKYQLIRNKCWKPNNLNLTKLATNRPIVNRSFTNFKSPLCRPLVHHGSRIQRLINAVKSSKSTKKAKSTKKKTRKRYYDDETKAKVDDDVLDDIEIAEKPSGPKIRAPIGALPSFITL